MRLILAIALLLAIPLSAQTKKSPGPLPPPGNPLPEDQKQELTAALEALEKDVSSLRQSLAGKSDQLSLLPDIQIYINAVKYPLVYGEAIDFKKAKAALAAGNERAKLLGEGKAPWVTAGGPRGYVSKIDGSVQPYLLAMPRDYSPAQARKWRVDFFCHGRGETLLELNFINGKPGEAKDKLYVQPYGRYCCANKFAGEIDILEILDSLKKQYPIDEDRVVLTGFSMGGAAVWHLAVHYPDVWCAASPGAGFAEIEQYQHLDKDGELAALPTWQRDLFHWYDATDYALNLYNLPLIAYAGTEDPQQQSGDVMSKACAAFGIKMQRIYGQGVGHKYEPKAKTELDQRLDAYAGKGRDNTPPVVKFETWTLRYNRMFWITLDALNHHWQQARVEGHADGNHVKVTTDNVSAITLAFRGDSALRDGPDTLEIDGTKFARMKMRLNLRDGTSWRQSFVRSPAGWHEATLRAADAQELHKRHGLQGPIDDAFLDSFIFVKPTAAPLNDKVGQWTKSEMDRAIRQWHNIFRGEAPVKNDTDITAADIANNNLVLWGDPASNALLAKILDKLPVKWTKDDLWLASRRYDPATHAPILIYPNPLNPNRYIVINSGFTFREDANGTNSRQIPRLPDWAIIDLSIPPDSHYPGKIQAAGFFGERWEAP